MRQHRTPTGLKVANKKLDFNQIVTSLRPTDKEIHVLQSAKDSISNILLNNQSHVRVSRIVPAGSFAKGTALRENWELDMVYLSPDVNSLNLIPIHRYIADLFKKNFAEVRVKPRSHSLELRVNRRTYPVRCDVLIGRATNSPLQTAQARDKELFRGTMAIWHKEYVKHCARLFHDFKDVVRLTKQWVKLHNIPLKSYVVELICAAALETARDPFGLAYYMEVVFRSMQRLTDGWQALPVRWDSYFGSDAITAKPSSCGVMVVDPADPSVNALSDFPEEGVSEVRREACRAVTLLRDTRYSQLFIA